MRSSNIISKDCRKDNIFLMILSPEIPLPLCWGKSDAALLYRLQQDMKRSGKRSYITGEGKEENDNG